MTFVAPKTLEKDPLTTPMMPQQLTTKTIEHRTNRPSPPPQIMRILNIINRFCIARRVSLMEQFKDKDRHNHKQCTANSFAQVIQLLGVHISKAEIDQLCTFYIDPTTHFVSYPDFVRDVRAIGGIDFYSGTINGKEVVLTRSGIGKVQAGVTTGLLIANYKVDAVTTESTGEENV